MTKDEWSVPLGYAILAGSEIGLGLTEDELAAIEAHLKFRFPPDLRELLTVVLPLPPVFPGWRQYRSRELKSLFDWPCDSICFDVEHSDFWIDAWGKRPAAMAEAIEVARQQIDAAPKLIPVYAHRYLPATPCESGNPIFSVHQSDVIYYGLNRSDYFIREFGD